MSSLTEKFLKIVTAIRNTVKRALFAAVSAVTGLLLRSLLQKGSYLKTLTV